MCTREGKMDYDDNNRVFHWCGENHTPYQVTDSLGGGGGGCPASGALIAGSEGAMQYDTTNNKMVFCGGTNWINIPN